MTDWLPSLSGRQKWKKESRDIVVGDVVLAVNPNVPRGQWPLGRVLETFPGRDGKVRTAKIQLGTSSHLRPVTKICLLEGASDE